MRIVHIIEALCAGGKERQMLELARGLCDAGEDVRIIVQSEGAEYDVRDLADRIDHLPRRARRDLTMVPRLARRLRDLRPDIVHSWGTMCSIYAVLAGGIGAAPLVCGHIRDAPSRLSRRDPRWWHAKLAEPFAAAIVANSQAGLDAYRVRGARAHVIHNGFDPARIARATDVAALRAALGIETRHAVGMVARFDAHKDHATFFAAAETLAARGDVTCLAIGNGPALAAWQARYAGHPRIRLTGRRDDVEHLVAAINIGVLATVVGSHGEGISNALTEFLAAGRAVVATDDGGNRELVGVHDCGVLVPSSDGAALADAIAGLLDDPARAQALGARGAHAIATAFGRGRMVDDWRALYRRIARR